MQFMIKLNYLKAPKINKKSEQVALKTLESNSKNVRNNTN